MLYLGVFAPWSRNPEPSRPLLRHRPAHPRHHRSRVTANLASIILCCWCASLRANPTAALAVHTAAPWGHRCRHSVEGVACYRQGDDSRSKCRSHADQMGVCLSPFLQIIYSNYPCYSRTNTLSVEQGVDVTHCALSTLLLLVRPAGTARSVQFPVPTQKGPVNADATTPYRDFTTSRNCSIAAWRGGKEKNKIK